MYRYASLLSGGGARLDVAGRRMVTRARVSTAAIRGSTERTAGPSGHGSVWNIANRPAVAIRVRNVDNTAGQTELCPENAGAMAGLRLRAVGWQLRLVPPVGHVEHHEVAAADKRLTNAVPVLVVEDAVPPMAGHVLRDEDDRDLVGACLLYTSPS